jgi:hypothetical protein
VEVEVEALLLVVVVVAKVVAQGGGEIQNRLDGYHLHTFTCTFQYCPT